MTPFRLALSALMIIALLACGEDGHDHGGDAEGHAAHPEEGPNGAPLIEIGDHVAHLEFIHDEDAGTITLNALGMDGVTPLALDAPPVIKVNGLASSFETTGSASRTSFTVTDEQLKMHGPEGRITVKLGGKTYNPELLHDHAH